MLSGKPTEISKDEEKKGGVIKVSDLIERFEDFEGRRVKRIKVKGSGSNSLKEDALNLGRSSTVPQLKR